MVRRETCPACKGNKMVRVERSAGDKTWRPCPSCNGSGTQIKVAHLLK